MPGIQFSDETVGCCCSLCISPFAVADAVYFARYPSDDLCDSTKSAVVSVSGTVVRHT